MKQVKIAYQKCKDKLPHRPPDEIDFGLGFRAGLRWAKSLIELEEDDMVLIRASLIILIEKELE